MTEKRNKNKLSDFIRYRGNKMSGRERNAFERNLQKDPFLEEASEGFDIVESDDAAKDLLELHKKLKSRTSGTRKFTYYRIAASVAVLMIISSVFIVLDKPRTSQLNNTIVQSDTINISTQESLRENQADIQNNVQNKKFSQSDAGKDQKTEARDDENTAPEVEDNLIEEKSAEAIIEAEEEVNARSESQQEITVVPSAAPEKQERKSSRSVRISEAALGYTKAMPVSGIDSFNSYIQKNRILPADHPEGQAITVKVNFKVSETGKIDSIKVMNNQGEDYSKEAIRLIEEGPEWRPAEEYGQPVEEKVTLDIIFR